MKENEDILRKWPAKILPWVEMNLLEKFDYYGMWRSLALY